MALLSLGVRECSVGLAHNRFWLVMGKPEGSKLDYYGLYASCLSQVPISFLLPSFLLVYLMYSCPCPCLSLPYSLLFLAITQNTTHVSKFNPNKYLFYLELVGFYYSNLISPKILPFWVPQSVRKRVLFTPFQFSFFSFSFEQTKRWLSSKVQSWYYWYEEVYFRYHGNYTVSYLFDM